MKTHEVIVRADRSLFARLLIVAQTRSLKMRDVLCCELGPLPWSLASVDESLANTAKSKLLDLLEKDIPPAKNVPGNAAWMIDAMALLQSLRTIPATFADLAMKAFDVDTAAFLSGSAFKSRGKSLVYNCCNRIRNYVMVFNDLVVHLVFLMICLLYAKRFLPVVWIKDEFH